MQNYNNHPSNHVQQLHTQNIQYDIDNTSIPNDTVTISRSNTSTTTTTITITTLQQGSSSTSTSTFTNKQMTGATCLFAILPPVVKSLELSYTEERFLCRCCSIIDNQLNETRPYFDDNCSETVFTTKLADAVIVHQLLILMLLGKYMLPNKITEAVPTKTTTTAIGGSPQCFVY